MSIAREGLADSDGAFGAAAPFFFEGATHTEALARLEHLVESGLHCGIVVGPRGTGKSTSLAIVAQSCRAAGGELVAVDVTGLDEIEFLMRLVERLEVTSRARGRAPLLWSEVADALTGRALAGLQCVLVIDHLDRATAACQHLVRRLVARGGRDTAETWILGFSGRSFPMVPREWREQNDLRIELARLSESESHAFLRSILKSNGLPGDAFEGVADALVAAGSGVPAELRRLAELALLLAHGRQSHVSPEAVASVLDELRGLRFSA